MGHRTKRLIVSVAILSNALISHEPNRYSDKKGNRDCVTKNFEAQVIPRRQIPFRKIIHAAPSVAIKAKHVKIIIIIMALIESKDKNTYLMLQAMKN